MRRATLALLLALCLVLTVFVGCGQKPADTAPEQETPAAETEEAKTDLAVPAVTAEPHKEEPPETAVAGPVSVQMDGRLYGEGCTIGTTVKPGNNYSSKDTTQISVNLVNWAYVPVYNRMTIEVLGESETFEVGSVYQYSVQQGGGIDYDKTVTCATLFGVANLSDFTNEELFKQPFTYSWVFRAREGMGAPTLIYVEHEDGSYETVRQQQGGGMGGGMMQQAPNPEGSEFPSDADIRFVGNTLYWTNFEGEKKVVVHTDDPDFAEFDGKEVTFTKNYNNGMGPLGKMDRSLNFEVADGYVKTAGFYGDHMNWAWADFAVGEAHGWINPNFVPSQQQGGGPGGNGGNGGQQGGGQQGGGQQGGGNH